MTINKLAIIGGSGLYDVEEFKNRELLDLNTPWGKPSDQILKQVIILKKLSFYQDMGGVTSFLLQNKFSSKY